MRAALSLALLVACSEPSIKVVVQVPDGFHDAVAGVNLQVLVPPVSEPFGCDEIAFDEVSDDTIHLSQIQELTFPVRGSAELSGIPREGDKLFLATGLDRDGEALTLGCEAHGTVRADDVVDVVMFPRAVLDRPEPPISDPLPDSIAVRLTDPLDRPLAGAEVRWTVVGPVGQELPGETVSDTAGRAAVEPEPPDLPGPVALDIKARWLRNRPPSVLAFQPPVLASFELPGGDSLSLPAFQRSRYVVGRVGPGGEAGFAALGPLAAPDQSREILVAYYDPDAPAAEAVHSGTAVLDPPPLSIGLLPGANRDRIVAALSGELLHIGPPDGSGQVPVQSTAAPIPFKASATLPLGPCGPDAAPGDAALLIQESGGALAAIGPGGDAVDSPFTDLSGGGRAVRSGCAADQEGALHRVVVFESDAGASMVAAVMDRLRTVRTPSNPSTVGFSPQVGDDPPYLLRHVTELSGASIARELLVPVGPDGLGFEPVDKDPSALLPISTCGGDFDGDGRLDVAALLFFGINGDRQTERLGVTLGVEHRGQRLAGISPSAEAASPQLFVYDLDGDGLDDVLVATPFEVGVSLMKESAP